MPDGLAVTPGSGATVATENIDVAGTMTAFQKVKFIDPTPGSTEGIGISSNPMVTRTGGANKASVATGTTTEPGVVSAAAGRIYKVIVIATNSAAISIYDNASAATGTVLFTVPANAPTGSIYDLELPVSSGITAGKVNNSPALLITYDD